ncbi:hypothetical protein BC827DRAFT_1152759 [Russula dissimulans]|nr:hypothetical protein BC827DRAFT_1152759 [Russula dissimulans]
MVQGETPTSNNKCYRGRVHASYHQPPHTTRTREGDGRWVHCFRLERKREIITSTALQVSGDKLMWNRGVKGGTAGGLGEVSLARGGMTRPSRRSRVPVSCLSSSSCPVGLIWFWSGSGPCGCVVTQLRTKTSRLLLNTRTGQDIEGASAPTAARRVISVWQFDTQPGIGTGTITGTPTGPGWRDGGMCLFRGKKARHRENKQGRAPVQEEQQTPPPIWEGMAMGWGLHSLASFGRVGWKVGTGGRTRASYFSERELGFFGRTRSITPCQRSVDRAILVLVSSVLSRQEAWILGQSQGRPTPPNDTVGWHMRTNSPSPSSKGAGRTHSKLIFFILFGIHRNRNTLPLPIQSLPHPLQGPSPSPSHGAIHPRILRN